jgi:DHA1 family bicyclomycin/chloramphenicol resistance-like MFS transporter
MSRELHAGASSVQLTLTACLIGIALGQLLLGPISDQIGRRPPLLIGLIAFVLSSIACALAPNVYVLAGLRLVQGLGGSAGIVISRSVVRDLRSGVELVKFFSTLMLMTGLGPLVAPQIGSFVLSFTSWRGVFIALAVFGAVLLATVWWRLPETLAPESRSRRGPWTTVSAMAAMSRDRVFLGSTLACGLGAAAAFAYIAGVPFALQNVYGVSTGDFSLLFALNACGMIIGAQINGRLASRFSSSTLLICGLAMMTVAGTGLLFVILAKGPLGVVIVTLFCFLGGWGFVGPNAISLALERYPQSAGAAAALIGASQFVLSAVIAPLAGVRGTVDSRPMAVLMFGLPALAIGGWRILAGREWIGPAAAKLT